MEHEELSARWRRFRVAMTRVLRPVSVALPIALVAVSLGFLFDRDTDGGWGNLGAIAFVAVGLLIALVALVRLREAHGGPDWLTRRDSVLVAVMIACAIWWLSGVAGLPALPDKRLAAFAIPAFINGMFGVCITLGLLIASARRALKN